MREVNPMDTNRAASWEAFRNAPMPMVTIFKTFDITNLMKLKEAGYKLNMLLCYCIVCAAEETPEFWLLPVGDKMFEYDRLGVNLIVANKNGGINSCDIPFMEKLADFQKAYLELTKQVHDTCENYEIEDSTIIGTSSLVKYEIDGVVNMYSGIFNNPFVIWGRYHTQQEKTTLQVSFQFHHVQMDGMEACEFLERVQRKIAGLGNYVVETKRLGLRQFTMEDLQSWHEILSDPETMQYYPQPFNLAKTRQWIEWNLDNYQKYGFGLWAVLLKETGEFIGDCGITMQNIHGDGVLFPEIGYHINKKFWRRGYASEAARACLSYAFEKTDAEEIFSCQKWTNLPSRKTAEKMGMSLREEYEDEKNTKTSVHSITREEYRAAENR